MTNYCKGSVYAQELFRCIACGCVAPHDVLHTRPCPSPIDKSPFAAVEFARERANFAEDAIRVYATYKHLLQDNPHENLLRNVLSRVDSLAFLNEPTKHRRRAEDKAEDADKAEHTKQGLPNKLAEIDSWRDEAKRQESRAEKAEEKQRLTLVEGQAHLAGACARSEDYRERMKKAEHERDNAIEETHRWKTALKKAEDADKELRRGAKDKDDRLWLLWDKNSNGWLMEDLLSSKKRTLTMCIDNAMMFTTRQKRRTLGAGNCHYAVFPAPNEYNFKTSDL